MATKPRQHNPSVDDDRGMFTFLDRLRRLHRTSLSTRRKPTTVFPSCTGSQCKDEYAGEASLPPSHVTSSPSSSNAVSRTIPLRGEMQRLASLADRMALQAGGHRHQLTSSETDDVYRRGHVASGTMPGPTAARREPQLIHQTVFEGLGSNKCSVEFRHQYRPVESVFSKSITNGVAAVGEWRPQIHRSASSCGASTTVSSPSSPLLPPFSSSCTASLRLTGSVSENCLAAQLNQQCNQQSMPRVSPLFPVRYPPAGVGLDQVNIRQGSSSEVNGLTATRTSKVIGPTTMTSLSAIGTRAPPATWMDGGKISVCVTTKANNSSVPSTTSSTPSAHKPPVVPSSLSSRRKPRPPSLTIAPAVSPQRIRRDISTSSPRVPRGDDTRRTPFCYSISGKHPDAYATSPVAGNKTSTWPRRGMAAKGGSDAVKTLYNDVTSCEWTSRRPDVTRRPSIPDDVMSSSQHGHVCVKEPQLTSGGSWYDLLPWDDDNYDCRVPISRQSTLSPSRSAVCCHAVDDVIRTSIDDSTPSSVPNENVTSSSARDHISQSSTRLQISERNDDDLVNDPEINGDTQLRDIDPNTETISTIKSPSSSLILDQFHETANAASATLPGVHDAVNTTPEITQGVNDAAGTLPETIGGVHALLVITMPVVGQAFHQTNPTRRAVCQLVPQSSPSAPRRLQPPSSPLSTPRHPSASSTSFGPSKTAAAVTSANDYNNDSKSRAAKSPELRIRPSMPHLEVRRRLSDGGPVNYGRSWYDGLT